MKKVFDSKLLSLNFSDSYLMKYSHIKIGRQCKYLFMPQSVSDLCEIYKISTKNDLPVLPLGGGSNILFGDVGDNVVISDRMMPTKLTVDDNVVTVSANNNINTLIMKLADMNLGGIEYLSGIPAHIGGLTVMNAGAYGKSFGNSIIEVEYVDTEGNLRTEKKIRFSYRNSSINGFITKIVFRAEPKQSAVIHTEIKEYIANRKIKQPLNFPNLGCIFKNPPNESAGRLIDLCGLKGAVYGGAEISIKHANFIINRKDAKFEDVVNLIEIAKKSVLEKFDINLETEIKVIGL